LGFSFRGEADLALFRLVVLTLLAVWTISSVPTSVLVLRAVSSDLKFDIVLDLQSALLIIYQNKIILTKWICERKNVRNNLCVRKLLDKVLKKYYDPIFVLAGETTGGFRGIVAAADLAR
jgi:hypothetical protein